MRGDEMSETRNDMRDDPDYIIHNPFSICWSGSSLLTLLLFILFFLLLFSLLSVQNK